MKNGVFAKAPVGHNIKSMKTITILFTILTFFSCGSSKKSGNGMDNKFTHKTIKSEDFERYILVKGENLKSVEQKLKDWGQLPAPGNVYTYKFEKAKLGNWTVVKLPKDLMTDHYNYHNMIYWFLGFPPEDDNYADQSVGLSVNTENSKTYLLYNDYHLREKMNLEDDMFGVFQNNQKFILSIPFDKFKNSESEEITGFQQFLTAENIDIDKIKNDELSFTEIDVIFNEK
jgi:hypothetical protein